MKLTNVSLELAEKHYAEHVGKPFYAPLLEYITSGPVLAMVLEGENAILGVRHIVGKTNPDEADVGSIRADFCTAGTADAGSFICAGRRMIAFHIGATDQGQDMFGANGNTKSAAFAKVCKAIPVCFSFGYIFYFKAFMFNC